MITLLLTLLSLAVTLAINSNVIIGFYTATQPGMLLEFIPKRLYWLPGKLKKPLFDCPMCMSSIHSTYIFIPMALTYHISFWFYPIYILALCGVVKKEMQDIEYDDGLKELEEGMPIKPERSWKHRDKFIVPEEAFREE